MQRLKLILRNALRHKLRSALTVVGIVIATLAFGFLQTVVKAWYAGANAASNTTLITRNAVSLVFPLPLSYAAKIRAIDGVERVAWANWFGGVYQAPKNFFPQLAVSGESYLEIYTDFVLPPEQHKAFLRDRKGAIIGRKLADQYHFRIGDVIPLRGTIFPGQWDFVVRGIYDGRTPSTVTTQMFFHWDYLNETLLKTTPRRANQVGVYVVQIARADQAPEVSAAIDATFKNSLAETLTETEKAFQLSFVSMSDAIVVAIRLVSYVVILIIMAVMANTMAMSARERLSEYATLKALGFGPLFVGSLIVGESLLLSGAGGLLGIALLYPAAVAFAARMGTLFPVFEVAPLTVLMQAAAAIAVGVVAAIAPAVRAIRVNIVDGLRSVA
ncbi:ABC transporter permease [Massilia solisilvae]|uniref:ABC transporter permease n=1 Tax=Massilia solisilvae TaxID=1811225 RepID=A0ABT2BFT0_9BURK|nr:ABC transporter permease [Massilia solisilvae]MCS0607375.1 ABC transporter permease [Massilia solisilvae]